MNLSSFGCISLIRQKVNVLLTQWSRACRKSKSSSVQSSSVEDLEPTLVSHCSRRSRVWTQCSISSHFCRTVSRESWKETSTVKMFHKEVLHGSLSRVIPRWIYGNVRNMVEESSKWEMNASQWFKFPVYYQTFHVSTMQFFIFTYLLYTL